MGNELACVATLDGRQSEGKALLETSELIFRGGFRVVIPFADIRSLSASDGVLTIAFGGGTAAFQLGARAAEWERKIRNPRSRLEKLGVKEGMIVSALGRHDEDFLRELADRVGDVATARPRRNSDLIFLRVDAPATLARLEPLRDSLARDGALWVIRPKGKTAVTERAVMDAGKRAGLVDTKVVAFSATHTAEKYVIPVSRR